MEVQSDFRDLLESFARHGVDYVIVGAYALAFHGVPRSTGDMDVFLGVAPVRVDLLLSISGVTWEEAEAGRCEALYGDVSV